MRTLQRRNPTNLCVTAQLQASHARRFLEIELSCLDVTGTVVFHGSAWCSATNPDTKFSQVVVPPVPLVPEAAVVALHRFKALEKRPRLPLVKNQDGHQTLGLVGRLSLTLDAEDVTADELASVYGRKKQGSMMKLDPGACGDMAPVLGKALGLSMQLVRESAQKLDLRSIEVETDPVAANCEIELRAASEINSEVVSILVTGWLRGKDVLRFRAVFSPSIN